MKLGRNFGMKFAAFLVLALGFTTLPSAFAGGGSTTPWPLYTAEELVGTWADASNSTSMVIRDVPAAKGQPEKIFVIISHPPVVSQGYLVQTSEGFCGTLTRHDGISFPMCLRGRFGVVSLQSASNRLLMSARHPTQRRN